MNGPSIAQSCGRSSLRQAASSKAGFSGVVAVGESSLVRRIGTPVASVRAISRILAQALAGRAVVAMRRWRWRPLILRMAAGSAALLARAVHDFPSAEPSTVKTYPFACSQVMAMVPRSSGFPKSRASHWAAAELAAHQRVFGSPSMAIPAVLPLSVSSDDAEAVIDQAVPPGSGTTDPSGSLPKRAKRQPALKFSQVLAESPAMPAMRKSGAGPGCQRSGVGAAVRAGRHVASAARSEQKWFSKRVMPPA